MGVLLSSVCYNRADVTVMRVLLRGICHSGVHAIVSCL